jgi:hypothetical protein
MSPNGRVTGKLILTPYIMMFDADNSKENKVIK